MALPNAFNYQLNGHNTVDALRLLHDELCQEIQLYETRCQSRSWRVCWRECFLHHNSIHSVLHWSSVLVILLCVIALFAAYALQIYRDNWLVVEAFSLLVALTVNIYFLAWDDRLRKTEQMLKAKKALKEIESCMKDGLWNSTNYINIHAPLSPCVTLQWTVREAEVINLPCGFLVEGDIILLRPGQIVPAKCRMAEVSEIPTEGKEILEYGIGEVYNPDMARETERNESPELSLPIMPQPCIVLETPFVENMREILAKSHSRPVSVLNNERYQMYSVWIERRVLPITAVLMLVINLIRYICLPEHIGHWTEMLLVQPVQTVLPMCALVFPIMWKLLDAFGLARLLVAYELMKSAPVTIQESFDDFDSDLERSQHGDLVLLWKDVWWEFCQVLRGNVNTLPRTSNLVHALGNITSFCCVDKKGVLSWPNPTAEKLFFLRNDTTSKKNPTLGTQNSRHSSGNSNAVNKSVEGEDKLDASVSKETKFEYGLPVEGTSRFEVLDLTQDPKNGYGLEFDDPAWRKYLDSLKPLGLNVLLNTCNMETTDRYTEFADHVTCASLKREAAVPVVNRSTLTIEALATVRKRCFCELARQMGFSQKAVDIFKLQHVLGMYRHFPPAAPPRDPFFHKSFIKYKMPMPNVFSVVVKEASTGMLQLFSQGTADLLLDTCSDYWDGLDLCPLSQTERKNIADFYHRTSMSSYCTAFSYRPLTESIGEEFSGAYIEVPENTEEILPSLKTPTPTRGWDIQSLDARLTGTKAYHGSFDSLMEGSSSTAIHDVEGCFHAQCNQIFIAMITMQYQAKQDIVQLIEDFDSACIRFVHFSKENELRSRVFSEKMGLEAGWNCHISLLSERPADNPAPSQTEPGAGQSAGYAKTKPRALGKSSYDCINSQLHKVRKGQDGKLGRRYSSPGAINLETTQVKFEGVHKDGPKLEASDPKCSASASSIGPSPESEHVTEENSKCSLEILPGEKVAYSKERSGLSGSQSMDDGPKGDPSEEEASQLEGAASPENVREPLLSSESKDSDAVCEEGQGEKEEREQVEGEEDREEEEEDEEEGCSAGKRLMQEDRVGSVESHPASSYITENTDSVTGALGLSNRAKLPKGIENIRPHIEDVDNVPLLVSLFTDCTPETTREMLQILQEYGEVVCCFGSSANIYNMGVFLQADCSLGVEPLYPQICMKEPVISRPWEEDAPTPMEVSAKLHSIPCALSFDREDRVGLIELVAMARQHCQSVRHTFLMLFTLQLSVSLLQLLCAVCLLPPILAPHHLLWLVGLVLPILSLAMMDCTLDNDMVKMAQGKNWNHIPRSMISSFLVSYLIRYVPAIVVCLACHAMTLSAFCQKIQQSRNVTCSIVFGDTSQSEAATWNGWYSEYNSGLALSQDLVTFQLTLYFICASFCFIHRFHHLWRKSPLLNKVWCVAAPLILLCQMVYLAISLAVQNAESSITFSLSDVPVFTWVLGLIWPLVLIPTHELVKHREIKQAVRYQKRARLDFGTKLGMNSPF